MPEMTPKIPSDSERLADGEVTPDDPMEAPPEVRQFLEDPRKVHLMHVPQGPPEFLDPPEPIQAEAFRSLDEIPDDELRQVTWLPPFRTEAEAAALAPPGFPDYDELPWWPPDDFYTNSDPNDE